MEVPADDGDCAEPALSVVRTVEAEVTTPNAVE